MYDQSAQKLVNTTTGAMIDVPMMAPVATTNAAAVSLSSKDALHETLYKELIRMYQRNGEYDALRVYLSTNHKDILEQFDAAYAARERIGVGNKP